MRNWRDILVRYLPVGMNASVFLKELFGGLGMAAFFSLSFLVGYANKLGDLYLRTGTGERVLREGAVMVDFAQLIQRDLIGFFIPAAMMIAAAVQHYHFHLEGSRSIYLMRRLPDRFELHRRCLTLPALGLLLTAAAAMATLLIYFALYMLTTPDRCIAPGQWGRIWR